MGDTIKCTTCHVKFHKKCVNVKNTKSGWACTECEVEADSCRICKKPTEVDEDAEEEEVVLICDGCEGEFHKKCIVPPLTEVPEGDWFCVKCAAVHEPVKKKRKF